MTVSYSQQSGVFQKKIICAFVAVYLIWGSTYLAIRFTIETLPPLLSAGLRFFTAGVVLYGFMCFKNKGPCLELKQWKSAFIAGAFLLLGGNGCVVWAERYVPSGLAALFIALVPLWMVLLEWRWYRGPTPSWGVLSGISIGFVGVCLLIAPDLHRWGVSGMSVVGDLLLLVASVSWSMGSVYARRADLPRSPFMSTAMQMMAGGSLLFLTGLIQGEYRWFHEVSCSVKSVAALMYLLIFGSLLGFSAYIWLLKNAGIARTSTYAFVNPVVAIFLGWILAGEQLSGQTALAAFFVVVAVMMITLSRKDEV